MSSLNKIQKNIALYDSKQIVAKTLAQYQAEKQAIHDMYAREYTEKLEKIITEYNRQIEERTRENIDTILLHVAYELGKQLGCFDKNCDYMDDKIDLVHNIMINVQNEISKYSKVKKPIQTLNKIKAKVKSVLKIEF